MSQITAAELAGRLQLRKRARDWRGNCPACGYLAALSVRAGVNNGALASCWNCQSREDLDHALNRITSGAWSPPALPPSETLAAARVRKRDAARRLWNGSIGASGTLVDTYLTARCLPRLATSPVLRFRDDCHHPQGGRLPAMIGLVVDVAGTPIAVHRTYMNRATARKASVEPAKASLGPVWGGAIRLQPVEEGLPLIIAEGIETAASAGLILGAPAWAAVSAGNLESGLMLPAKAVDVIIAADPDAPGEKAARAAARRWQIEGRSVRIARTGRPGADFNDKLMERHHG